MLEHVNRGDVPRCQDKTCRGLVKPDIVFFGEQLPKEFSRQSYQLGIADLVIVIGTSLTVHPFAALPEMAPDDKPRVLFNLDRVGQMGTRADDVLELGDCDAGIRKLADELGWREELEELWKKVVGEKEAKWQKASRKKHEDEVEEEVTKLAEDVEAALKIEDTPDQDSKANETGEKADTNQPESKEGTSATEPIEPRPEEVKADAESKDQAPNEVAAAEAKPAEDGKDKDIKDGRDTEKSVL